MKKGNLILINGASSAGKTSTCRALQDLFQEQCVLLGLDVFSQITPPKQNNMATIEPHYFKAVPYFKNNKRYFKVETGPFLDKVIFTSYRSMAVFLDAGIHVIADELFWSRRWLHEALCVFQPYTVYFIGLLVSEEEGARREKQRGSVDPNDVLANSRLDGWNRTSAEVTHHNMIYDFSVDNTALSVQETAKAIKNYYDTHRTPSAFAALYQKELAQKSE